MGKKRRLFTVKRSDGVLEHRASNTKLIALRGHLRRQRLDAQRAGSEAASAPEKNAAHWNGKLGYRAEVLTVRVTQNIRDADYDGDKH